MNALSTVVMISICTLFYLLPTIIACSLRRRSAGVMFILNVLLGWTAIVWVFIILWALVDSREGTR